jgi:uncharacterized protein (DUF3084 family)
MLSDTGMTADELDDRFARLEALMRTESAETRRHMDVVAEGLQLQIQVIAEGHDALRADVGELKAGQRRLEAGMARLEVRQDALEYRQARVETRLDGVETRLASVEAGQAELADGQRALVTEVRLIAARRRA